MREFVRRVTDATPPGRDRALDALRALAILGVVLGHWLVTALVADSGTLRVESPLGHLPELTPVSWAFQTLAVFFFVGGHVAARGHAAARARGESNSRWIAARLGRFFRPVVPLLAVWAVASTVMLGSGVPWQTLHTLGKLVLSPLWFLLVLAALTAATPLVARVHPLWPLAVVLHVDVIRFGLDGPDPLGWLNLPAGWLVPYCLGALLARRPPLAPATAWTLLLGGAATTALLVAFAGYPGSMVGVPGAPVSNLNPPTLAAVTFGLAQCGAAVLLLGPLRRALRRPVAWAAVAALNLGAMTVFLWHQTAMIAVTAGGLLTADRLGHPPLTGLHTVPDGHDWVLARLGWLPLFAAALLVCAAAFHTYERTTRTARTLSGRPGTHRETRHA
ncbi:acyltransferase family protein [Streptomyces roseicoloratus]|uniref:Acyltransferase n=1 Tax=Streptomyces roseicoloratus TaxID=2508722 RepID=A0ABY9S691_9ACTN|nr:acyltransferase [Streptomyces roseicoloratus]WMX48510.1 acyltransferase [Streptomyces roseicoloratus]